MRWLRRLLQLEVSEAVHDVRLSPEEPEFYEQWAKEAVQSYIQNTNAALGQLLTLSTSLFGGAIAFWEKMPFGVAFRYATVAALLWTVIVCLLSAMPIEGEVEFKKAGAIRETMEKLSGRKRLRLLVAKWSLLVSLGLAAGGLLAGGVFGCSTCAVPTRGMIDGQ